MTTTKDLEDEQIVRLVLRGDRDAFGVLVRRYERRITAHVYRIVGNRDVALEIAQDAFLKAFRALARFDPRYRFSTWMYSIAGNAAIDHVRKRRPEVASLDEPLRIGDSELQREPKGEERTAAEIVEGQELVELLEKAIAELPTTYREVLLLRHPGDLSYDEIAATTGLPLGTVKNRIFRARERLKELLGNALPADVR